MPDAVERSRAGIWVTSPSPTVRMLYVSRARPIARFCWSTPMARPPRMLTAVMMSPATASPRTNFEAPSIEP
jgi:hypothetical protein